MLGMLTPPTALRRAARWLLDVDPRTRGWTPPWVLWVAGVALAMFVAVSRANPVETWNPQPYVLGHVLHAARRMLAGEAFPLPAIDLSTPVIAASTPLTLLAPQTAAFVILALSGACAVLLVRLLGVRSWAMGLAAVAFLASASALEVLERGDWLLVLTTMAVADATLARHATTRRWSGFLGGAAVAASPIFALFALPGLIRNRWSTLWRAAVGFGVANLPAVLLSPRETWAFWRYHQLNRLAFDEEMVDHQPFASVLVHNLGIETRWATVALLALVWGLAAALVVLAVRRERFESALAAAGVAAFFWAAWPAGSLLLLPLAALLFSREPGRGSRVPAAALLLIGVLEVWRRLPEAVYATSLTTTTPLTVLILWWLVLHVIEMLEVPTLRPVGRVCTWPIVLMPFLAAYFLAGTFFYPRSNPWNPWVALMPDFNVYIVAANNVAAGLSPYAPQEWPYLYPPIAAFLALPTVPWPVASQVVWMAIKVTLWLLVMYRIGLRGWRGPFVLTALMLLMGSFSADFMMGNIQGLMVALVFLDLAPGRTVFQDLAEKRGWSWAAGRTHLLPHGVLTGFVTAIKIIPGLFLVLLLLQRQWRPVRNAVITGAAMTLLGAVLAPKATLEYAGMLLHGQLNQDIEGVGVHYVSLVIGLQRFVGEGAESVLTLVSLGVGAIGFFAAWRWYRAGRHWIGLSLCGIATVFFSPVAWNYYYVWLIPALLIVVRQIALDTPMPRWVQFILVGAVIWASYEFHLKLPNGDNPEGGEFEDLYTLSNNVVAGMLAFSSAAVLLAAAVLGRRRRNPETVPEPDEESVESEELDANRA